MSECRTSTPEPEIPVTIAMSSGLLFKQEQQGYGPAFKFVKALKAVNAELTNHYPDSEELFKVKLINDSSSSDFLMNRIREHGLEEAKESKGLREKCPIRTYLVTSRGADCGGYRALNTLRTWGLELDEAVLLGGANKGPTLQRIKPHIFFDDQQRHVDAALEVGTVACLVLSPN
uniref:cytosolic 5'-nucleotidase 1A n=1 Tax=Maylandia zebra TaxID=106582 RepID=UPI000D301C53|nr:cytosolic 5'-nucleotidase 1A-like [Maylandia zebra]